VGKNLTERIQLGGMRVDVRIILRPVLKNWGVCKDVTECIQHTTGTSSSIISGTSDCQVPPGSIQGGKFVDNKNHYHFSTRTLSHAVRAWRQLVTL